MKFSLISVVNSTQLTRLAICLLILLPFSIPAKNYMTVSYVKQGKTYTNQASVYESETNKEIHKFDLGRSSRYTGEFFTLTDNSKLYYYLPISKIKSVVKVFDKSTYELLYSLDIEPLDIVLVGLEAKYFIANSPDFSKLYIQTNYKKNRKIVIFDNQTGELQRELPLPKGKSYSELSNNGQYIIAHHVSRYTASIFDATSFKQLTDLKFKASRKLKANYNEYLFTNVKVKHRNKRAYKSEILNLKTMEKLNTGFTSNGEMIYVVDEINNKLFIAGKDVNSSELVLKEFSGGQVTTINTNGLKLKPKQIITHEESDKLLVIGTKSNLLLDLSNPTQSIQMDQPFDTANVIWNPKKQKMYLREGSGSEVAAFDTVNGKKIKRSGTGRAGVKFGQFLASAAFSVVQYNLGYVGYAYKRSSTQMLLNAKENSLYVINSKTNDVTKFNADNLTGREALATGSGTSLIYQHDSDHDKLLVLSSKKITIINDNDFKMIKQIKYQEFLGLDLENALIFVKQKNMINSHSMVDGSIISKLPLDLSTSSIFLLD